MSGRAASARREGGATRIAAVVPVHDGGGDIRRSLSALLAAGQSPSDVLVVDDASTDGAARAAARELGTRYEPLAGGPHGPARARNAGARLAATDGFDAFLFVDADVLVHADAVARFAALLDAEPDVAAAFGSYDDTPPAPGWVSQYKNLLHHRMHQTGSREACTFWSGCGIVRRAPFEALGGFDETFDDASIEDVDLGLRLTDAGHRVRLCPDILSTHLKAWSLGGWLRTDVFKRALPWSRLLHARGRGIPDSLNLGRRERLSAALALVVVAGTLVAPLAGTAALGVAALALIAFALLQRDLLGFFARRRGLPFALAAALMHIAYYVYSSVVFVGVRLAAPFNAAPFPRRS